MIDWNCVRAAKMAEIESLSSFRVSEVTPSRRDFRQFLGGGRQEVAVIGTVRRRDPYTGRQWQDLDVAALARELDEVEVAAIAVSTESTSFAGKVDDLSVAAAAATAPILRDDFVVHPSQLYQSRALGADAAVVPVGWLDDDAVAELLVVASSLHMAIVLGVFGADELPRALRHDKAIVGVWGPTESGQLDLSFIAAVAAAVPTRRTLIALGDVPEVTLWAHLRGLVDAALLAAPLLGSNDIASMLAQLSRD